MKTLVPHCVVRSACTLAAILAFTSACEGTPPTPTGDLILLVELKTDLVAGVEFAAVRTQLFDAGDRTDELARRQSGRDARA